MKRSMVDGLERGRIKLPSPDILNRLARVLPVSMHELLVAMGYRLEQDDREIQRLLETRDDVAEGLRSIIGRLSDLAPGSGGDARPDDEEPHKPEE